MEKEVKEYVEQLVKEKLTKSEKPERNVDNIFKSEFRLGSTLEQTSDGNVMSNTRQHDPQRDLEKAYNLKKEDK